MNEKFKKFLAVFNSLSKHRHSESGYVNKILITSGDDV